MKTTYNIIVLSDLLKKSRNKKTLHPDYQLALDFIFGRIDKLTENSPNSQFNKFIRIARNLIPDKVLPIILLHLRYDAAMFFRNDEHGRAISGMVSFQKHPITRRIGMFDIYIDPERRNADTMEVLADVIHTLSRRFTSEGYVYLQCGRNETTTRLMKVYKRILAKKYPHMRVEVETSRIYL